MFNSEKLDFGSERKEHFNRADCVSHTARTFSPIPSPLGQEIEFRYLPDDVYVRTGEPYKRLHILDTASAQRISQFADPGVELTDERLQVFHNQESQARKAFGPTVVAHARQLGLVEVLNPEEATARLALAPSVDLAEEVEELHSSFSYSGWGIFPDLDTDQPVLLVPRTEQGQILFEAVNLDSLYAQAPNFLPQQIRDYEEIYAMSSLAQSVTYNLNLHETPEEELFPEFIREIAHIVDPEQRAQAIQSMKAYMTCLIGLGYNHANTVYYIKNEILSSRTKMADGRSVDITLYLKHMTECPAQTEVAYEEKLRLVEACNAILSINHHMPSLDHQTSDPVNRVLQDPAGHTVYLDLVEQRNNVDREQHQKNLDFIAETEDISDRDQILEVLKRDSPEFYETVIRFQEWLGASSFGKSKFDELISRTAGSISYADETYNIEKLNTTLRKELKSAVLFTNEKFEGVHVDSAGLSDPVLYNPHLEAVLPLLAIKQAQAEAEAKRGDRFMGDYHERQVQRTQRLTQGLAQSYKEKLQRVEVTLKKITDQRAAVASFKEQTGITDEEIAHLIELATPEDREDDDRMIDSHLYIGLFNALVLEKQGVIDMHSPAFKSLLKSVFPGNPESVWHSL